MNIIQKKIVNMIEEADSKNIILNKVDLTKREFEELDKTGMICNDKFYGIKINVVDR